MMKRKHMGLIIFLSLLFLCRFINIPLIGVSPVSAAAGVAETMADGADPNKMTALTTTGKTVHTTKVQVATPTFTPAGGTYASHPNVVISCKTAGAIIRYTTYGGEPTSASPQYTGPIPVIITTTLKAKAFRWDMADSNTAAATYAIGGNPSTVATPAFSPAGGTYASPQNVSLSCGTVGATIRYTTNGSEPTASSMLYSAPIPVNATATLKAKAFKSGLTDSNTAAATYTVGNPAAVATPTFAPAAGTYAFHPNVVISCNTVGAIIRYTTYGSEPTSASPQYIGPIPVMITTTLKAKAFKAGMTESNTAAATYTIE